MNNLKDLLKSAKDQDIDHTIFKNVININCNWENFLEYIEIAKNNNSYRSDAPGFYILNDITRDYIDNFFNASTFRKQVAEAYNIERYGFSIVIFDSENGKERTGITKHTDQGDTIHMHCVGQSIWTVWNTDGTTKDYHTSPGDVVFVKTGIEHSVKSLSSRAGIVFVAC